jgi:hypothetical protein
MSNIQINLDPPTTLAELVDDATTKDLPYQTKYVIPTPIKTKIAKTARACTAHFFTIKKLRKDIEEYEIAIAASTVPKKHNKLIKQLNNVTTEEAQPAIINSVYTKMISDINIRIDELTTIINKEGDYLLTYNDDWNNEYITFHHLQTQSSTNIRNPRERNPPSEPANITRGTSTTTVYKSTVKNLYLIGSYFDFVAKETAIEFHCKQKDDAAMKEAKKIKKDLLESKKVIPALPETGADLLRGWSK